jgi:hypothetical protein
MSIPFQVLVKHSAMLKYGLLGVIGGLGLTIFGLVSDNSMPERSALQKIEGEITEATKITTKGRRSGTSVKYKLAVTGAGGTTATLTIPEGEITEFQVRSIMPTRIAAEYDSESDVYVLSSNGKPVFTYEQAVAKRHDNNRFLEGAGLLGALLAGLIAGIGYLWTKRKLTRQIAEYEAAQGASGSGAT